MLRNWLLLDVNYLAHRALHSTGGLEFNGQATGVMYGMFREVFSLREKFGADHVVWCLDWGPQIRKGIYPDYKKRKPRTPDEDLMRAKLQEQLDKLPQVLEDAGCKNIVYRSGLEADDCIAVYSKVLHNDDGTTQVIVSADQDLYQLLRSRVSIYDPRAMTEIDIKGFKKRYGISPKFWPFVKAVGGCTSDNIKGMKGVGEGTAIKYIRGETNDKTTKNIQKYSKTGEYRFNERLVKLPLKEIPVHLDETPDAHQSSTLWKAVFKKYGFRTLIKKDK